MYKTFSFYFTALLTVLVIISAIQIFADSPVTGSEKPRWEYGYITSTRVAADRTSSITGDYVQHSYEWATLQSSVKGKNRAEVYRKLGGSDSGDEINELGIFDLLGEDGWEFVERDRVEARFHRTITETILWRRAR